MDILKVSLFGHVTVIHPNHSAPLKLSRSSQALLAYLLLRHHLVHRDILMDLFWTDSPPKQAQSSLTTAIWRLRKVLEPMGVKSGSYLITENTGGVGFNWDSHHWLDTAIFEQQSHSFLYKPPSALCEDEVAQIEETLRLYHGELLEGIYEDWVLSEREHFRLLHLNCLTRLMEFHASKNNFERSIAYGQEILWRDPLREDIHRNLMRIYLKSGQHILAIRQYRHCWELLNQELGIPPLEETQMLYRQIIDSAPTGVLAIGQAMDQDIIQLSQDLQLAERRLSNVSSVLARIAKTLNHPVDKDFRGLLGKQNG